MISDPSSKKPNLDPNLKNLGVLGFQLAGFNLLFFWLGYRLDENIDNRFPLFLVISVLLSVFASFWYLIKKLKK